MFLHQQKNDHAILKPKPNIFLRKKSQAKITPQGIIGTLLYIQRSISRRFQNTEAALHNNRNISSPDEEYEQYVKNMSCRGQKVV